MFLLLISKIEAVHCVDSERIKKEFENVDENESQQQGADVERMSQDDFLHYNSHDVLNDYYNENYSYI